MSKSVKYHIFKVLVVVSFISVLVGFGLVYNKPEQGEAAETQEFGDPTCDVFIPIGTAMDGVLGMLDRAFRVYNGEKMDLVMDNMAGLLSVLTENPNVCDFTKCMAQVDNLGPQLGVQFNAFFWKGGLSFKMPPWCVPQEGIGEPCPDISQYLEDNDKNIVGLKSLKDSFMASAEMLHDIFENKSERLSADLVKPNEDIGDEITKADLYLRLVEKAENQLTPGTYQSCSLSELERQLVADGRLGDRYPLQCKAVREQGLYWPRLWSEGCREQCEKSNNTKECIECLDDYPGDNASQLAKINYKIYGTCKNECSREESSSSGEREWELTKDCEDCLCSVPVKPVSGSGGITGGAKVRLSGEECLDWLCGGSSSNWVCCHQRPLEETSERPDILTPPPSSPTPAPAPATASAPPSGSSGSAPPPPPGSGPAPSPSGTCVAGLATCQSLNCGQDSSADCSDYELDKWAAAPGAEMRAIDLAVKQTGSICESMSMEDTKRFIKAIISQESHGEITSEYKNPSSGVVESAGLVHILPTTAAAFKGDCDVPSTTVVDNAWMKKDENAQAQICMAIEYLKTLVGPCGCDVRHLAAGYNGGGANACGPSTSCQSCSMCPGQSTRRWECLWDGDDGAHNTCNTGFENTRGYVPRVHYCYEEF